MINYNLDSEDYLGYGADMANRPFHAFVVGDEMHIVYRLNESDQYVATETIQTISENIDKYLWTPFAQFICE